jgi:hypothetical protein
MRNISTKFLERKNAYFMFKIFLNHAFYEKKWKYFVEPDRPQMTIRRKHMASRILKTTNAPSAYVVITAFPLQHWLHERTSMLLYTYIACTRFAFDSHKTVEIDKFRDVCIVVDSVPYTAHITYIQPRLYFSYFLFCLNYYPA